MCLVLKSFLFGLATSLYNNVIYLKTIRNRFMAVRLQYVNKREELMLKTLRVPIKQFLVFQERYRIKPFLNC